MRKLLAAILAIIYIATSTGATIHIHYCMGKLVSWSFASREKNTCPYCGMAKARPAKACYAYTAQCCHEQQVQLKTGREQVNTAPGSLAIKAFSVAACNVSYSQQSNPVPLVAAFKRYASYKPPHPGDVPIFLINSNFRI